MVLFLFELALLSNWLIVKAVLELDQGISNLFAWRHTQALFVVFGVPERTPRNGFGLINIILDGGPQSKIRLDGTQYMNIGRRFDEYVNNVIDWSVDTIQDRVNVVVGSDDGNVAFEWFSSWKFKMKSIRVAPLLRGGELCFAYPLHSHDCRKLRRQCSPCQNIPYPDWHHMYHIPYKNWPICMGNWRIQWDWRFESLGLCSFGPANMWNKLNILKIVILGTSFNKKEAYFVFV